MPQNSQITTADVRDLVMQVVQGGQIAGTESINTGMHSAEASRQLISGIRDEVGEQVAEAMEEFCANYEARFGDEEALDAEEDDAPGAEFDDDDVQPQPQFTEEQRNLVVVGAALAARPDNEWNVVPNEARRANWHNFLSLSANPMQKNKMKSVAQKVFGRFPCFDELKAQRGANAVNDIKTVLRVNSQRNANPQARAVATYMSRFQGYDDDVERIGRWVRDNAIPISRNKVKVPTMLPDYEANAMFAVSEDETFLMISEKDPIDAQYIYSWPGGRQYYAQHPEALERLVEVMSLEGGMDIDLSNDTPALPRAQTTPQVEDKVVTSDASDVEVASAQTEDVVEADKAAEPEPQNEPEPQQEQPRGRTAAARQKAIEKPVTRSAPRKPKAAPASSQNLVAVLRGQLGFKLGQAYSQDQEKRVPAAVKQTDTAFLAVLPDDGATLPLSKSMRIEYRDDLSETGIDIGQIDASMSREDIADLVETAMNYGSGPRP